MATYEFKDLKKQYENFSFPVAVVKVNGKDLSDNKHNFTVSDIEVELTSGYEASIASFIIYNTFDRETSEYKIKEVKPYILLGSSVEVALGYSATALNVFRGFIAKVNFVYEQGDIPGIKVTAMDVKGVMMANNYSKQLTATNFGDAVKEILGKNAYVNMTNKEIIKQLVISDTPDKPTPVPGADGAAGLAGASALSGASAMPGTNAASDRTIEMVCESDYEFVVKAAKKYNYEFFTDCGVVYFRKAKSDHEILMELAPETGLRNLDVEYDLTGLVESVQTRGMDTGKGKVIQAKKKFSNKISIGNKANAFIKKSEKVYIDPTITSQDEADSRAESLMEEISYRFGTLECDCIGLPELKPGHFIKLKSLGTPPGNLFYIVNVRHVMDDSRGYETKIVAKTAGINQKLDLSGMLGGLAGGMLGDLSAAAEGLSAAAEGISAATEGLNAATEGLGVAASIGGGLSGLI